MLLHFWAFFSWLDSYLGVVATGLTKRTWVSPFQKAEMWDTDTEAVYTHWADTLFCWKIKNSQHILCITGCWRLAMLWYNMCRIIWITLTRNNEIRCVFCSRCSAKMAKVFFYVSQGSVATYVRCGGNVINVLLQIPCWIQAWKNFENRSTEAEVMYILFTARPHCFYKAERCNS